MSLGNAVFKWSLIHWLGEQAFNLVFYNDLKQLVQHLTHILDCLGDLFNILDLFPTFDPLFYSDENILSAWLLQSKFYFCILSYHSCTTSELIKEVVLLTFFQLGGMIMYFSNFSWNSYCFQVRDPSVCAQCIRGDCIWGRGTPSIDFTFHARSH